VPAQARLLERRFDARHQVQLSRRERLANLQGAFAVPPAACAGARVVTWRWSTT
jgi:predicted amidophosphoribosyltransferase